MADDGGLGVSLGRWPRKAARELPALEDNVCQVWWARPAHARPSLDRLLDPVERDRRARLRRQDDQDRLTVGAALARLVLAHHLGSPAEANRLRFDRTCGRCGAQHGKPQLVDATAGLEFSITHSGARVAVAVARGSPVGVDVEQLPARSTLEVDALAAQILSDQEQTTFQALAPHDRLPGLLTYWTRKEALLKATGDGLGVAMTTITVSGPREPPRLERWDGRPTPVGPVTLQRLHPGHGYIASLAVLGLPVVQLRELDAGDVLAVDRPPRAAQ